MKEWGAERKVCAEMCEVWRKGREEWERGVVSGSDSVKEWGAGEMWVCPEV